MSILNRSIEQRRQAAANLRDFARGRIADTTGTPADIIDEGRKRAVHRYRPTGGALDGPPVLLIPPMASQASCFDLHRGCSLAAHLSGSGRPTYLVDYGRITRQDADLGVEFWVNEVLPLAIRTVSEDAGGQPVALVGWCLGGIMALLSTAAHRELPIGAVAMVASPFDFRQNPMLKPHHALLPLTGGRVISAVLRVAGGAPDWLVKLLFKASAASTYIKKPATLFKRRDDRDALAHIAAVDAFMNEMLAYPGRAALQLYNRLALRNELATGKVQGPNRLVDLADVTVPVMNIAGSRDVLAPVKAVHHIGTLLPNAKEVRLPTAPGGHLGVLTGRTAPSTTWTLIDEFLDATGSRAPGGRRHTV
jgi:polyhydroxyalkanoate synthase